MEGQVAVVGGGRSNEAVGRVALGGKVDGPV